MSYTRTAGSGAAGSAAVGNTATSATVPAATAGNLLLFVVTVIATADPTFVGPSGYTQVGPTVVNPGVGGQATAVFIKIAAGGETQASASWTGNASWACDLSEYSSSNGWASIGSIIDTVVTNSVSNISSNAPSVTGGTMSQADELLIGVVASAATVTLSSPSGGFTQQDGITGSGSGNTKANLVNVLDKSPTGIEVPVVGGTLSASRNWSALVFGFKAATAGAASGVDVTVKP